MIELPRPPFDLVNPRIKIFGIGNAGSNALDRIVLDGAPGVDLIAVNTDAQTLAGSVAPHRVQIGQTITRGLGAGGDPDLGKTAAEEGIGEILGTLADANVVFLVVGLGGGTGSGAAPVIAEVAREHGAMIVVVATIPFAFEGKRRLAQAEESLAALRQTADVLLCFENDKMADAVAPNAPIQEAFAIADRTISESVRALASFAGRKGLVHTSFDEVATAFRGEHVRCLFGCGQASGDNRAHEALDLALRNPLLNRARLRDDVDNVVVSIVGGSDLTLNEVQVLMEEFQRHVRDRTRVFFGAAVNPALTGTLSVNLLGSFEVGVPVETPAPAPLPIRNYRGATVAPAPVQQAEPEPVVEEEYAEEAEPAAEYEEEPVAEQAYESEEEEEDAASEPAPAPVGVSRPVISTVRTTLPPFRPSSFAAASTQPAASVRPKERKPEQMQLEPINRGRFEKSEPTIIDGQDLDVPTFLRRPAKGR